MMVPDLHNECVALKIEFDIIKQHILNGVNDNETADYYKLISKLNNKKVEKILYKLKNFPEDISPNRLVTLSEELEN